MSVLYSILPIDEEDFQAWNEFLVKYGFEIPAGTKSRYPTPSEIRQVLDEMPEYTKRYSVSDKAWDVDLYETASYDPELRHINGKHATIYSVGPAPDETLPLHIYFHSGWEEVNLEIVLKLTQFIGPVLFMKDSDAVPVFVSPSESLVDLLNQWEKNRALTAD